MSLNPAPMNSGAQAGIDGVATGPMNALSNEIERVRSKRSIEGIDVISQCLVGAIAALRLWKGWDLTLQTLLWTTLAAAYLAPAWIAFRRAQPHRWMIAFASLAFGWTLLGWVFTLGLALGRIRTPQDVAGR